MGIFGEKKAKFAELKDEYRSALASVAEIVKKRTAGNPEIAHDMADVDRKVGWNRFFLFESRKRRSGLKYNRNRFGSRRFKRCRTGRLHADGRHNEGRCGQFGIGGLPQARHSARREWAVIWDANAPFSHFMKKRSLPKAKETFRIDNDGQSRKSRREDRFAFFKNCLTRKMRKKKQR